MPDPLHRKRILLGVTGSIACYKAADLASKLRQAGAEVDVILSRAAQEFITPLTFQSVSGRRAYTDADLWGDAGHVLHIGLAEAAHALLIAPATANTLAKLAHGQADSLLTVAALAARCPIMLAPAMDGGMWAHPATQENVETLRARGAVFLGPVQGHLASGLTGVGRMMEPAELLGHIRLALSRGGLLAGKKVVVTAGGTQEPLDPVRMLTNRSSGRQGYALAQAALDLGADVILVTTPSAHLPTPAGAQLVSVGSAIEMRDAVITALPGADALIMAAAVADFRPAHPSHQKIKKTGGVPQIELTRTPDILGQVAELKTSGNWQGLAVGFAAESQNLLDNARTKLSAKKLDLMVANDISADDAGFAVDTNRVTLLFADGSQEQLPLMSKEAVAERVMAEAARLLGGRKT